MFDKVLNTPLKFMPNLITSILKNNFHLISKDPKLSKNLKQKPTAVYQKNKPLSCQFKKNDKNDIANQKLNSYISPCGKCKLSLPINIAKIITNGKLKIMKKIKGTGNCKEGE